MLLGIVSLMMPGLFGFQSFTQWGGMYVNAWCSAYIYPENPAGKTAGQMQSEFITAGVTNAQPVWSAPQFNAQACVEWSRSLCGSQSSAGWTVGWVAPHFRDTLILASGSACDLPLPPHFPWFSHAG